MPGLKNKIFKFKSSQLQFAGILVLLVLATMLLWVNELYSMQSEKPIIAGVRFYGEYRIGDGQWQKIIEGEHISSTKGDVTLRGDFHMLAPDGKHVGIYREDMPIAFYIDHIRVAVYEGENESFQFDNEHPLFGSSACGAFWSAYVPSAEREGPVEIRIHNPHNFGNETAIDEMLTNIAFWSGIDFEKNVTDRGQSQRNTGLFLMIVSFALLGSALFSELLHIPNNRIIWLMGASILSAGIYLVYSAVGVSFWSDRVALNTNVLGFSMMFYMLFIAGIITTLLERTKIISSITAVALGTLDGVFFLLPMVTDVRFYDTWLQWVTLQSAANGVLLFCMIKECSASSIKGRWRHLVMMMLLLLAFEADALATAAGWWKGGVLSRYTFFALFVAALFVVLRQIPESIQAAEKAKALELQKSLLEAELKENRVSIMLSQIRPHFIYNTLGTIERMCLKDPEKAFDLVRNFSLYLRGNFNELDSVIPVRFAEELKHVEHYVNIEKVRFPDMNIEYEVDTTDFVLPALSVQPLVENAIKHGLMRLESGGTVVIRSYETPTHFCVEVTDDGVGFDTTLPVEGKKHVGLRNIRGRLKAMVNGELILESKVGVGTKAVIMIPKEVTV